MRDLMNGLCLRACFAAVGVCGFSGGVLAQSDTQALWEDRAEQGQRALEDAYWLSANRLFANRYPPEADDDGFNYWWQAHTIDALIDGHERTGEGSYLQLVLSESQGIRWRNGGLYNDYYDDELWYALALLRLTDHVSSSSYVGFVDGLWEDIKGGWNDDAVGGMSWRKPDNNYRNVPSNGPTVILGARLYMKYGDPADLAFALMVYEWMKDNLIDPESGFAWDGVSVNGDGTTSTSHAGYTYNQGVVIGAGVELYRATGDDQYLMDARRTFLASVDRMTLGNLLLTESGQGDGGLFKGIYVRYVGLLAEHDSGMRALAERLIGRNARVVWGNAEDGDPILFSQNWRASPPEVVDLSTQLSGVMLMEQMARHTACEEKTVDDLLDFLAAFADQDISKADYAPEDNPDGVLNVDDVLRYLAVFAEGCG